MRQRNERRFEAWLVTCRCVHVAKLRVRGYRASPGTHRDECAVAAVFPGAERIEAPARGVARQVVPAVDVAGRQGWLAGEARTGVERPLRSDGVGVRLVNLARPHVHAVDRLEAVRLRFLAEKRHLLVDEVTRVADRSAA